MIERPSPPEPDKILESLEGRWRIVRRIPGTARLRGVADFTPLRAGQLAYKETGTLLLANGQTTTAEREYIFAAAPAGFDVYFVESPPRLFHEARLSLSNAVLVAECEHLCIADNYRSRYRWRSADRFSIFHRVKGPRKNYCMVTTYTRIED